MQVDAVPKDRRYEEGDPLPSLSEGNFRNGHPILREQRAIGLLRQQLGRTDRASTIAYRIFFLVEQWGNYLQKLDAEKPISING
jgi:hypothetical protein